MEGDNHPTGDLAAEVGRGKAEVLEEAVGWQQEGGWQGGEAGGLLDKIDR